MQEGRAVVVTGWAWDREARTPPRKVLLATPHGWIVGFGEMAIPREDVLAAVRGVADINIGWEGPAKRSEGAGRTTANL